MLRGGAQSRRIVTRAAARERGRLRASSRGCFCARAANRARLWRGMRGLIPPLPCFFARAGAQVGGACRRRSHFPPPQRGQDGRVRPAKRDVSRFAILASFDSPDPLTSESIERLFVTPPIWVMLRGSARGRARGVSRRLAGSRRGVGRSVGGGAFGAGRCSLRSLWRAHFWECARLSGPRAHGTVCAHGTVYGRIPQVFRRCTLFPNCFITLYRPCYGSAQLCGLQTHTARLRRFALVPNCSTPCLLRLVLQLG